MRPESRRPFRYNQCAGTPRNIHEYSKTFLMKEFRIKDECDRIRGGGFISSKSASSCLLILSFSTSRYRFHFLGVKLKVNNRTLNKNVVKRKVNWIQYIPTVITKHSIPTQHSIPLPCLSSDNELSLALLLHVELGCIFFIFKLDGWCFFRFLCLNVIETFASQQHVIILLLLFSLLSHFISFFFLHYILDSDVCVSTYFSLSTIAYFRMSV